MSSTHGKGRLKIEFNGGESGVLYLQKFSSGECHELEDRIRRR